MVPVTWSQHQYLITKYFGSVLETGKLDKKKPSWWAICMRFPKMNSLSRDWTLLTSCCPIIMSFVYSSTVQVKDDQNATENTQGLQLPETVTR